VPHLGELAIAGAEDLLPGHRDRTAGRREPEQAQYAVLALLALQPWTTYQLATQMERGLGWIWPRAISRLYEEPKKLVAAGLATSRPGATGRRRSTVYSITPKAARR